MNITKIFLCTNASSFISGHKAAQKNPCVAFYRRRPQERFLTEHGTHPLHSHRMSEAQVESLMLIYEAPSKEPQRRRLLVKVISLKKKISFYGCPREPPLLRNPVTCQGGCYLRHGAPDNVISDIKILENLTFKVSNYI